MIFQTVPQRKIAMKYGVRIIALSLLWLSMLQAAYSDGIGAYHTPVFSSMVVDSVGAVAVQIMGNKRMVGQPEVVELIYALLKQAETAK